MGKSTVRIIVDIMMVALLVVEMLYLLTGNILHEILGAAFFVTMAVHLILSRKMFSGMITNLRERGRAGNASKMNRARMVLDVLLFSTCAVLLVSSVLISNILMSFDVDLAGGLYGLFAMVHVAAAYVLCGLVVLHGALHWAGLFRSLRIPYNPGRRKAIGNAAIGVAAIGMMAIGASSVDVLRAHADQFKVSDEGGEPETESASSRSAIEGPLDDSISDAKESQSESRKGQSKRSLSETESGSEASSSNESRKPRSSDDSYAKGTTEGSESSSGSDSSICPLCPKRCSLSNPRCNKPYRAGLV